jgi:sulfur relay (sulfurtransferase) DsrF/TusC family protein
VFRKIAIFILGIVLWGSSSAHASANLTFTVNVYNDAKVSPALLQHSESIAGKIFQQAGFAILWRDCTQAHVEGRDMCLGARDDIAFTIRIVPHSLSLSGEAFGVAFVGSDGQGAQADVFYSGIEQLTNDSNPADIMGHVMAHELGHLLLGLNSHSSLGIMQAHWTDRQLRQMSMGFLKFDKRQSEAIGIRLLSVHLMRQDELERRGY